eukprot:comp4618_c0_seq1/m.815 comp4618_c0_seq1/g.815  ORF comp4618_c0_seq1/g.815 comp4618_c0_seq1/m.815 type:complete len:230 (-) comp4618_c0_seq1:587-1276(-)
MAEDRVLPFQVDALADVPKKDIVEYLQVHASVDFLRQHKIGTGKAVNVAKAHTKEALDAAYRLLVETNAFKTPEEIAALTSQLAGANLSDQKPPPTSNDQAQKPPEAAKPTEPARPTEPPKYKKRIVKKGNKTTYPKKGDTVSVRYTGRLPDGKVFDSNQTKKAAPLRFKVGTGRVIRGWDEALLTMSVGEVAEVTIEPEWAYGKKPPAGSGIPADSVLIFDMELVAVD